MSAGHDVEVLQDAYSDTMGHAGAVVLHPDGTLEGGHDPRADGGAAGRLNCAPPRSLDSAAFRDIVLRSCENHDAPASEALAASLSHCRVVAAAAHAHPHVWVTMKSELVYAPDGG